LKSTYPPASYCTYVDPYFGQGYSHYHPLIISAGVYSDFIVTEYSFDIMGFAYSTDCRKRQSDPTVVTIPMAEINATLASWGTMPASPRFNVSQYFIPRP